MPLFADLASALGSIETGGRFVPPDQRRAQPRTCDCEQ